ncbi:thioredoxin fold domain-containing protein [Methylibium rhizosphaerae]|uniref:thioredoxin fold domain-containing protein n=1 Tax=Methylibium rhizosphaerae TaxID=2570323 RepID=UPI00112B0D9B|nr:thioredoxin fold domain-containing protein [Methylibium rhizosphaerae]
MNRRLFTLATSASVALLALSACKDKPAESPAAATAQPAAAPQPPYEAAAKGHGFTIGQMMAANAVYVFFDPTCPHCAQLWMNSKPLLGKLRMVWIPISLRPSTAAQGATILSASDPMAAMEENEASVLQNKGGITASQSLSDEVKAKVKANTELWASLGADSVPYIVFKNARSGQQGTHAGAVDAARLSEMVGL